jgi:hypothetical protein
MTVGNKVFYPNEPVIYFDSLKTSTMEGAATTVYAQGGRGNSRLVAWEGERTVTFTMEDALISTLGLAILTGANVIDASEEEVVQHITETVEVGNDGKITVHHPVHIDNKGDYVYVMKLDNEGNPNSEPYIYVATNEGDTVLSAKTSAYNMDTNAPAAGDVVLVDYYTLRRSGAQQIEIEAGKFGGNFYLEASTLFRDTRGVDMPAEFIIPNCKIQSNFTFTMASSGDPSTFTFTMDAFPDYTRWNRNKKVLSAIQIITDEDGEENKVRSSTADSLTANAESVRIIAPDNAKAGKTVAVQAEVEPNGSAIVTWSVNPPEAGRFVPAQGNKVNFVIDEGATGTATVTADAEGVTDTHTINITAKV